MEITLPAVALEVRGRLDEALHRRDRHIGVITGGRDGGLYLAILLTGADDDHAARSRALRLLTAALEELDLTHLTPHIQLGEVTSRPVLPGGAHRVDAAPPLAYRSALLPAGQVLHAACSAPLGEWFAYAEHDPDRVFAGRSLGEVLRELLELSWGSDNRWLGDVIAELAGHATGRGVRYPCPCCDCLTLEKPPPGTHAICEVCVWEDDRVQFRDPDYRGGANRVSLREARQDYRTYGKSDAARRSRPRRPRPDESPPAL